MKKILIEMWVTDESAERGLEKLGGQEQLDEMIDGDVLGVRVALPGGVVLRAGETFG